VRHLVASEQHSRVLQELTARVKQELRVSALANEGARDQGSKGEQAGGRAGRRGAHPEAVAQRVVLLVQRELDRIAHLSEGLGRHAEGKGGARTGALGLNDLGGWAPDARSERGRSLPLAVLKEVDLIDLGRVGHGVRPDGNTARGARRPSEERRRRRRRWSVGGGRGKGHTSSGIPLSTEKHDPARSVTFPFAFHPFDLD